MTNPLAITPRNLGSVNLESYCPKCMKMLLHQKFHAPFNHFGAAIFSDLQKSQEAVIGYHLAKDGHLPKEFAPFCDCVARTEFPRHWSKYSYTHKSGIVLYGAPDEIFDLRNGDLCVIDLKTAHTKAKVDPFYPQYQIQVVGYGDIAEGLGLGTVTKGGLMYWECQTADLQGHPADHYKNGVMSVSFTPATKEIEMDFSILDKPLKEVKKLWNARTLPDGREGCDDCRKLDLLFALDEEFRLQDRRIMETFGGVRHIVQDCISRDFHRRQDRLNAMFEVEQLGPDAFANDGLVANWEFVSYTDAI